MWPDGGDFSWVDVEEPIIIIKFLPPQQLSPSIHNSSVFDIPIYLFHLETNNITNE